MNDDLKKASTKATKATRAKAKVTYSAHAIHLVRTAQLNTLTLSQMADQKASILMGATFLVFSLTVSRALVGEVSLAMLILAFGHFAVRDEQEWQDEILEELQADETVFRTMLHDIYQNGQVLQGRKYKFLTTAYRIFIAGLIITMFVYLGEAAGLIGI